MSNKVLIIGGVAGGAGTAARFRRLDETAEIVVFERGSYTSYANCGLPYHIGNVIKERDALFLVTPEAMKKKYNIDVRVRNEVIGIDRENKTVQVKKLDSGEVYNESYDKLVISTGSSPLKPPIEGIDSEGIYTLWTIPDTDAIKNFITERRPTTAAVIGGGFIGLEMVENLHDAGCKVSLVEMLDQVMAPLDFEMAQSLHENIRMNQVDLLLGDGVSKFQKQDNGILITLKSGRTLTVDLVILSIGVRPNGELAKACGLQINEKGGIVVSDDLVTSDPDIYAVGDVIEVEEYIGKGRTMIPLAGPANKQARICANNLHQDLMGSSQREQYHGTQGTSVAKVFDLTAATTGVNVKTLERWGKKIGVDFHEAMIIAKSHAGYYPGATQLLMKLIFDNNGKILGAQGVGQDGVDKRIDTIATAIRFGGDIYALEEMELAYAPPYSSAKDPVNMLGFVADNILSGMVGFVRWNEIDEHGRYLGDENFTILDVTEKEERTVFQIEGSYHIPLGQLRNRIEELDRSKLIIPYCGIGIRSYNAARILTQNGFQNVKVYPAGSNFFQTLYHEKKAPVVKDFVETGEMSKQEPKSPPINISGIKATFSVDCSGLQCPGPILKVFDTIKNMQDGDIVQITATDMGFGRDIETWCRRTNNTLLYMERVNKETRALIQKGAGPVAPQTNTVPSTAPALPDGKTIIVFSGDLDRVLASFIIANGAAAMGRQVTMFFTFWGLNVLRKSQKVTVKKPIIDAMFGMMMPQGIDKLKLSKMNMGGMGTAMMKKVMRDKNVNSLQELIQSAMGNGVKIVACTMSMDIMGITKEELIEGVELAGVGAYLGDAEESNVNLFI